MPIGEGLEKAFPQYKAGSSEAQGRSSVRGSTPVAAYEMLPFAP